MRLRLLITWLLWVIVATNGFAQRRPPIVSPELGDAGLVSFRIAAPDAQKVEVLGQWPDGQVEMTKNNDGVWEAAVEAIPAGVWEYSLRVDGLTMIDPSNSEFKPMRSPRTSILHIPGEPALVHDFQDVAHGAVHMHTYSSPVSESPRQLAVYTPPGYEQSLDKQYPLLVLQHGSGDNQATWVAHGKAHWIADNLIAEGKAQPMLIVMLDGHITTKVDRNRTAELFERDLMEHVLPFIEATYRVSPSASHRAIAGLSMGGGQSLSIGLKNADKFAWVAGFSSSIPSHDSIASALDNSQQTNQQLELLWIACGKEDFLLDRNQEFIQLLESKGIEHEWHLTEGNHSWPVWRTYLADILPRLFHKTE